MVSLSCATEVVCINLEQQASTYFNVVKHSLSTAKNDRKEIVKNYSVSLAADAN